jgi:hypothetical protein
MTNHKVNEDKYLYLTNDENQSIFIQEMTDDVGGIIKISGSDNTKAEFEFNVLDAQKIFLTLDDFLRRHVRDWDFIRSFAHEDSGDSHDEDDFDDEEVTEIPGIKQRFEDAQKVNTIEDLADYFKKTYK